MIDWTPIIGLAIGVLGLSSDAAWALTFREFDAAVTGYKKAHGIKDSTALQPSDISKLKSLMSSMPKTIT